MAEWILDSPRSGLSGLK